MSAKNNISRLSIATATLSMSVLLFELVLIRVLSVLVAAHVAFLGISLALFGLAIGGIITYSYPKFFNRKNYRKRLAQFTLLYAASIIFFVSVFFRFDYSELFSANSIVFFVVSSVPFVLANVTLSLLFKFQSGRINTLYFFDLVGAAAGVVGAIFVMNIMNGIQVIIFAALVATASAFLYSKNLKKLTRLSIVAFFIVAVLFSLNQQYQFIHINYIKFGPEEVNIFDKWNSFSRVVVVDNEAESAIGTLPEKYQGTYDEVGILIDSQAWTSVTKFNGDLTTVDWLRHDLSSMVYHVRDGADALVIGPGGGRDVLTARVFGYNVKGVDINPIIVEDIMQGEFREYSGNIYGQPEVEIEVAEGRSYLMRDEKQYDAINIPLVDTWSATASGNLYLVENHLYTTEAFVEYLSSLNDEGILTISRWDYDGPRLLSLFFEASKEPELGIENPEDHVIIVGYEDNPFAPLNNQLFSKTPFTKKEVAKVTAFAEENGFKMLYAPGEDGQNGKAYDNEFAAYINTDNRQAFVDSYENNIAAVTDDKPFFFYRMKPSDFFTKLVGREDGGLMTMFIVILIASLLCVLIPAMTFKNKYKVSLPVKQTALYLSYFTAIGLAFIMFEIVLVQRFFLYLEHPIYSYSVVLAVLLLVAGIGSIISKYEVWKKTNSLIYAAAALTTVIVLYALGLEQFLFTSITLPIVVKIFIAGLIAAVPAFFMGLFLPLGIKQLHDRELDSLVPWCWAINGAASVLATIVTIILSIMVGYSAVFLIAAVLYLLVPIPLLLARKSGD